MELVLYYPAGKDDSRIPCQVRGTDPDIITGDAGRELCRQRTISQNEQVMEKAMKRTSHISSETRELTDKELSKITSAMGDNVRSQSLIVSNIIQENLKAEFATRRKIAPLPVKARKSVAS